MSLTLQALTVVSSSARAVTLTPISDDRQVYYEFCASPSGCSTTVVPPAPFQPWTGSAGGASQTSSIDPLGLGGSGSAIGSSPSLPLVAASTFSVTFSIDSGAAFELSGTVEASIRPSPPTIASASAQLLRADTSTVIAFSAAPGQTVPFDYHGYLDPGTYKMYAVASSALATPASWSFSLVVPEPEPSLLLWLAATGLLALRGRRAR